TTEYLCELLDTTYLGCNSFILVSIQVGGTKDKPMYTIPLRIFLHHGKGAAQTRAGSMAAVEKMSYYAVADLYLMGHDHGKGVVSSVTLELNCYKGTNLKVIEKEILIARTGSFLKSREDGEPSYPADMSLSASSLGWVHFDIVPRRTYINGYRRLYLEKSGVTH